MHSEWIWDFLWHYSRSGTLKSWPTYTNTREMYKILKFHPEKLSGKKKKKVTETWLCHKVFLQSQSENGELN